MAYRSRVVFRCASNSMASMDVRTKFGAACSDALNPSARSLIASAGWMVAKRRCRVWGFKRPISHGIANVEVAHDAWVTVPHARHNSPVVDSRNIHMFSDCFRWYSVHILLYDLLLRVFLRWIYCYEKDMHVQVFNLFIIYNNNNSIDSDKTPAIANILWRERILKMLLTVLVSNVIWRA